MEMSPKRKQKSRLHSGKRINDTILEDEVLCSNKRPSIISVELEEFSQSQIELAAVRKDIRSEFGKDYGIYCAFTGIELTVHDWEPLFIDTNNPAVVRARYYRMLFAMPQYQELVNDQVWWLCTQPSISGPFPALSVAIHKILEKGYLSNKDILALACSCRTAFQRVLKHALKFGTTHSVVELLFSTAITLCKQRSVSVGQMSIIQSYKQPL